MEPDAVLARCAVLRRELADLVDSLDERQLATSSLCGRWDVSTVAAHLTVLPTVSITTFLVAMARARGNFDRANDAIARRAAAGGVAAVTATLRQRATSRKTPPGAGAPAVLTDLLVHGADIRLPLGLPFEPEPADVVEALGFVCGSPRGFTTKGRLDGIRVVATDVELTRGDGADLAGRAADLLLAICGRPVALERLTGPGVPLLAARI